MRLSSRNPDIEQQVRAGVRAAVREFYTHGFRYFLSGMAEGFDLWAADEVLNLRNGLEDGIDSKGDIIGVENTIGSGDVAGGAGEPTDIKLIAVVPFEGQAGNYPAAAARLYRKVLEGADSKEILSEHYFPECFHRRNDWLVEHASAVICYFDGQSGGTQYTVSRARRAGLPVYNILNPAILF